MIKQINDCLPKVQEISNVYKIQKLLSASGKV